MLLSCQIQEHGQNWDKDSNGHKEDEIDGLNHALQQERQVQSNNKSENKAEIKENELQQALQKAARSGEEEQSIQQEKEQNDAIWTLIMI